MLTYIIKRLLLMIPTFFAICVLVFVILNFAPGNPGGRQIGSEGGQQSNTGEQRESYRLFKEQFNLDKPILFNTRYNLSDTEVEKTLRNILNLSEDIPPAVRIAAQDDIENWGRYAVPALISILQNAPEVELQAIASQRLTVNARRRLLGEFRTDLTPEQRSYNKEVVEETNKMRGQYFVVEGTEDANAVSKEEAITFWTEWYALNQASWDYSASSKAGIFFTDTRFAKYFSNLLQLNFGVSHIDKRPVLDKIFSKIKYSLTITVTAVILIYAISLPLGIWSAVNQNSPVDRGVTVLLFVLYSLPSFFTGVVLLNYFTRGTPFLFFPTAGFESLDTTGMTTIDYIKDVGWHIILPIICSTYAGLAALSRYARTGLLDIIRADFIRTARAKGLPEGVVIIKHAARNGMIPIITLLATILPVLIGGSVVIEVIFNIPGMGRFAFESIIARDYNAIMAVLLISSALTLIGMLISDLTYALVDPRITFD